MRRRSRFFVGCHRTATTDPDLHFGLGVAVLHQLKYAEAEREFIQTVKLKPDYGEAYGYLADAARENKHYELAIRALDAGQNFCLRMRAVISFAPPPLTICTCLNRRRRITKSFWP